MLYNLLQIYSMLYNLSIFFSFLLYFVVCCGKFTVKGGVKMGNVNDNIRKRRQQLNLTQEQLAQKMGYADKGMISRIENGKIGLSKEKIEQFAAVLQISPVELMGYVFEPEVQKDIDGWVRETEEPWEHIEEAFKNYDYEKNQESERAINILLSKLALMSQKEQEDVLNYVKFVEWKRKQKGSD